MRHSGVEFESHTAHASGGVFFRYVLCAFCPGAFPVAEPVPVVAVPVVVVVALAADCPLSHQRGGSCDTREKGPTPGVPVMGFCDVAGDSGTLACCDPGVFLIIGDPGDACCACTCWGCGWCRSWSW